MFAPLARRAFSSLGRARIPKISNEPMLNYAPGSPELANLKRSLDKLRASPPVIGAVVNGAELFNGPAQQQSNPGELSHKVAQFHHATGDAINEAINGALAARKKWASTPFEDRAAVFLKAADLLATKYRSDLLAATMLGQGKNIWQAEIDVVELVDFWRFNVKFAQELYDTQPTEHSPGVWNRVEYRALEGFVLAISPFNFTAIGGNLASSPALMGNVVLWKPSDTAVASNRLIMQILTEAGLPPGVIQFVPAAVDTISPIVMHHKELAGLHFTGSTKTFRSLWSTIANNLAVYRGFPRIVGETGGKNFHFVHESADVENVVNNTIRGAFEYSGQKCSATSRMYVPQSLWPQIRQRLVDETAKLKLGPADDPTTFVSAVIDGASFGRLSSALERAKANPEYTILAGGTCDNTRGYYVAPTIIQSATPHSELMLTELFGPVLTVYVYENSKYLEMLEMCANSSVYALTGSFFARDRYAIDHAHEVLKDAAGNFYINDKSTGAVVGQQPFGGARASGTNDKAGFGQNLLRWVSAQAIKENFVPITAWSYPHMKSPA